MQLFTRKDITAKLIARSITESGIEIVTEQLRYPRIVHSEFMTHRDFSRNASSSRAIPVASILVRDEELFVPLFRRNKPGMQPGDYLSPQDQVEAARIWTETAETCIAAARKLSDKNGLNVHKQWANRLLESFGYIDVLVTSTDWANFDALRIHDAAQDEIHLLALAMREARTSFAPTLLKPGEWHLPYIKEQDRYRARAASMAYAPRIRHLLDTGDHLPDLSMPDALLLMASAARACRLSYSKHDGSPTTFADDLDRWEKLVPPGDRVHASPLEHQATPLGAFAPRFQANFRGWAQFRQFVEGHVVSD